MRSGFIDPPYGTSVDRRLSFAEAGVLDDLDLVIWRPAAWCDLFALEPAPSGSSGVPAAIGRADAERLVLMSRHWRAEFAAFVGRGGTLAILDPGPDRLALHTVQDIVEHDATDAYGDAFASRIGPAAGPIAAPFGEPFKSFFDAVGDQFEAASRFDPGHAQAMAVEASSGAPCALYLYRHPGRVVVLPALRASVESGHLEAVLSALTRMVLRLSAAASTTGLADAARQGDVAESPERAALRSRLTDVVARRRALQAEEARLQTEWADLAFLDRLDGGEPDGAMAAAALILHALGTYSQSGPSGTGSVMFDVAGEVGVLVALASTTAPAQASERLESIAALWRQDVGLAVRPMLYVPVEAAGSSPLPTVSRRELLQAYEERDRDAPRRWLERAGRSVGL